jgi:hypothetical protein
MLRWIFQACAQGTVIIVTVIPYGSWLSCCRWMPEVLFTLKSGSYLRETSGVEQVT